MVRYDKLILPVILLLTFALGFFFLFFIDKPNSLQWPDSALYYESSISIINGKGVPFDNISPGYPYFLAFLALFSSDLLFIKSVHIIFISLCIYAIYLIGKLEFNYKIGLISAGLSLLYPYFFYIPIALYPESIAILLFPWLFVLAIQLSNKFSWTLFVVLCFLSAFIILLRPTNVYILGVIPFYWSLKKRWKFKILLMYTILLSILPTIAVSAWIYRNYSVYGSPFFSRGAESVLLQTYNANTIPGVKKLPIYPQDVIEKLDKAKNANELAILQKQAAMEFIRNNKGKAFKIAIFNCINYWNPFPPTYTTDNMASEKYKKMIAIPYTSFIIMGVAGFFMQRNKYFIIVILFMMALNTVLNAPLMVSVRYRVVIDFSFIIMAACFIYDLKNRYIFKNNHIKIRNNG